MNYIFENKDRKWINIFIAYMMWWLITTKHTALCKVAMKGLTKLQFCFPYRKEK
jgi:hypothetical protein